MSRPRKKIWVISGTHWDREWRYTADESLLRLSEIVDGLLRVLERDPEFKCFHLDGGTVVIEDYLLVRPEKEERLREFFKRGRIATVPWYTLPEMNTVAPEALIRNLLLGTRMAGLTAALTYRGTNKHQVPPISLWEGADGTRIHHIRCFDEVTRTNWYFFVHYELVLGKIPRDLRTPYRTEEHPVHMADEILYQGAFQLLNEDFSYERDPERMRRALRHFLRQAEPQAVGRHVLALDMEDNATAYRNLPRLLEDLNRVQDEYELVLASLDDYVSAAVAEISEEELPVIKGELRFAAIEPGFNGLLGATHSSRVPLKIMNNEAERELIAVAEPLSTLSSLLGGEFRRTLIDRAWSLLLKCHCHDSICGAAVDEAHRDMPQRFRAVTALARETSRKASEYIWKKLDTEKTFEKEDLTLTFFNTLPFPRKGVVPVVVDTPVPDRGDLYVEACSGVGPITEEGEEETVTTYDFFDLVDENGATIPWTELEREETVIEVETKLDSSAAVYNVVRHRLLLEVEVPPLGYRTYALRPRRRRFVYDPKPAGDRELAARPEGILENEFLKVEIRPNGTFDLTDKRSGVRTEGMHYFLDDGSVGNAHQHRSPLRDFTVTSLGAAATINLVSNNELSATWRVDVVLTIPREADPDGRNRSSCDVSLKISSWLTLRRGARRLEIRTRFDNPARDHRLRVMFPTGIRTNHVSVESAFDIVERRFQWLETGDNHEGHYPFQPMLGFVDLTDGRRGLAFMSRGLREYEVLDDPRRTLAVTLMRSHRAYMRANRGRMTPEDYERSPGQHSLGPHEISYALVPHGGDWREGGVALEAEEFNTPWRIIQGVPKPGEFPVTRSMFSIAPADRVRLSALYQGRGGSYYVLRVWNSASEPLEAEIRSPFEFSSFAKVALNEETVLETVSRRGGSWIVPLRAKEIATLRFTV